MQGSVTLLLSQLQLGDRRAAEELCARYRPRLLRLARARMNGIRSAISDEEDVVQGVLASLCGGAAKGHFQQLENRIALWRLLATITARRVSNERRSENRQKRGGRIAVKSLTSAAAHSRSDSTSVEDLVSAEPGPEFVIQMQDTCEQLLRALNDPVLKHVAVWRMQGYSTTEIAQRLGCADRTVRRKILLIRAKWRQQVRE